MAKDLERDLGLVSVIAISVGAMVGSGIFILPGIALKTAGPAVILAYLVAGLLVLPAALSKAEMATAMPEAGGTYIYIERGMGPLPGTVAGVGTWFSLSFKGALALVGGVPYLLLLVDLPMRPVALGLAAVLILVNLVGVKQTGRFQVAIVVVMLAALGWFAAGSAPGVQGGNYADFLGFGIEGVLAATGLVFVSYAGVTKVASVAEEVEEPGRNIPIGILGSLAFTTVLYVAVVAVLVGVTDPGSVAGTLTPVAVAAEATLGRAGVVAVILAAVLALVSTANAGILSSSRYPFAMSRDQLAPPLLSKVSERFGTPLNSITLTGAVLLVLIAFVPILDIAKLASAFQIMVFALINGAVVAFREGSAEYEPEFTSPLYPWMQGFGAITGVLLLTQMGTVALVGAVVIVLGSIGWYVAYVRPRVSREGVATDAVRRRVGRELLTETESVIDAQDVLFDFVDEFEWDAIGLSNPRFAHCPVADGLDSRLDSRSVAVDERVGGRALLEGLSQCGLAPRCIEVAHCIESPVGGNVADGPVGLSNHTLEPWRVVTAAEADKMATRDVLRTAVFGVAIRVDPPEVQNCAGNGAGCIRVIPLWFSTAEFDEHRRCADRRGTVVGTLHPNIVACRSIFFKCREDTSVCVRTGPCKVVVGTAVVGRAEVASVVSRQELFCLAGVTRGKDQECGVVEDIGWLLHIEVSLVELPEFHAVSTVDCPAALAIGAGVVLVALPLFNIEQVFANVDRNAVRSRDDNAEHAYLSAVRPGKACHPLAPLPTPGRKPGNRCQWR